MEIENVKRVTLNEFEAQEINNVIKMVDDIAGEFDTYSRCEVFEMFLDNYYQNEGHIDNEIAF